MLTPPLTESVHTAGWRLSPECNGQKVLKRARSRSLAFIASGECFLRFLLCCILHIHLLSFWTEEHVKAICLLFCLWIPTINTIQGTQTSRKQCGDISVALFKQVIWALTTLFFVPTLLHCRFSPTPLLSYIKFLWTTTNPDCLTQHHALKGFKMSVCTVAYSLSIKWAATATTANLFVRTWQ